MPKNIDAKTLRGRRLAAIAAGGISLALASLPGAALAADTQLAWQGIITITASTTACSSNLAAGLGDPVVSVFRPKIKSTDSNSFLSFHFFRSAFTLENTSESTVHQMHGSGNYDGFAVDGRALFFDYTGTYSLTITPAAIVASTPVVTITGKINNYFDTAGCNVTFEGVYGPYID